MSGTYNSAVESASSTISLSAQASELTVPILQVLPYITLVFSGLQVASNFILSLFRPLLYLSPLPILLYVLAPVVVFMDIVATIFIRSPYNTVIYLLEALFPLYVFCGVACIIGALLGLAARLISRVIVAAVTMDKAPLDSDKLIQDEPKVDKKGKGRKVEKVKLES